MGFFLLVLLYLPCSFLVGHFSDHSCMGSYNRNSQFSKSGAKQCHKEIICPGKINKYTFNGEMGAVREILWL